MGVWSTLRREPCRGIRLQCSCMLLQLCSSSVKQYNVVCNFKGWKTSWEQAETHWGWPRLLMILRGTWWLYLLLAREKESSSWLTTMEHGYCIHKGAFVNALAPLSHSVWLLLPWNTCFHALGGSVNLPQWDLQEITSDTGNLSIKSSSEKSLGIGNGRHLF